MKKVRKGLLVLFICLITMNANAQLANNDCPPVVKLKSIYLGDSNFKQLIDSTFANVQNLPDGTPNFWKSKNINDLYSFLNQWFYTLPGVSNGLDNILKFSQLYYHNPNGLRFVNQEPGLSWTIYFVKEQGKFMDSRQSTGSISEWLKDSSLHNEEYIVPRGATLHSIIFLPGI